MAGLNQSLFIKYGLGTQPTETQIQKWSALVEQFIRQGVGKEEAGERAARQTFPDYNTHVYSSAADTIDALLAMAKRK